MKAVIIKTDGTRHKIMPGNNSDFTLEELQSFVGGYIEFVYIGNDIMVVNEEGKIKGLELNLTATRIVREAGFNDVIVGNILLCDSKLIK